VTERLELERARFESAELFRTAFENAPTGMVLTDVSGVEPVLVQCNTQYATIVGRTLEELIGLQMTVMSHDDDVAAALEGRRALIAGEIDRHHMEIRTQRPDGSWIWCSLTRSLVRDADGQPKYSLSQVTDITEAKLAHERIERFAFTDPLTGLANRRAFLERLDAAVERCASIGASVALAFIDLDHFKTVNDRLGHDAGDELLIAVANGLTSVVRSTDVVARLGGDEFALIITNIEQAPMHALAERIGAEMHFPRALPDGGVVTVTASIGLAWALGDETVDEFLRRADAAMYRAKHLGRDQIVFDTPV
jgi:diguanylate cyclase (GGDEF)-like protein/PAS domain S-box-containing protein